MQELFQRFLRLFWLIFLKKIKQIKWLKKNCKINLKTRIKKYFKNVCFDQKFFVIFEMMKVKKNLRKIDVFLKFSYWYNFQVKKYY